MEKNLIFEKRPDFIVDLGSGYSNVHMNVTEVEVPESSEDGKHTVKMVKKFSADVQRVKNPVTYEKTVNTAIQDEFPNGEDAAALRKGIVNPKDKDFLRLNEFAEHVKSMFKEEFTRDGRRVLSEQAHAEKDTSNFWEGVK